MKITKDDLRTIIKEVLEEGQWYDIKVKGAGSKKKKKTKGPKRVKKMPNIPGQPGGPWDKSVATMEEDDKMHRDPSDEDCKDWVDLIAIAEALGMKSRAIGALKEKAAESGCREVLDEDANPLQVGAEAAAAAAEAGKAAGTRGGAATPIGTESPGSN